MKKSIVSTILVLALSLIMFSCGSTPQNGGESQKSRGKLSLGPDFTRGSKYWPSGKICASAGEKATSDNIDQRLDYATQEARKDLAREFRVVIEAVYKDLNNEITAKGGSYDESAKLDKSIHRVSDFMLSGTERYDADTTEDMVWVLVCCDREKFRDAIQNSTDLSEELKEAIMERATKEWDELSKSSK